MTKIYAFATLDDGLEIRRTSLPNTVPDNQGLFTTRSFRKRELVSEYTGDRISREQAIERRLRNDSSYIKGIDYYQCIDGDRDPDSYQGIAQFTNDGSEHNGGNNTKFIFKFDYGQARTRVFLQATRNIEAYEEIFVSYGKNYWAFERPRYAGQLTPELVVNIRTHMRSLQAAYDRYYQEEAEDKSDHYEIDFIVDANFDTENRLCFVVQWNTRKREITTVDAADICHNIELLEEFYAYVINES
jgi:hypothetical protein